MKKILIFSLIAFFALQVSAQRLYSYQKKTSYTAAWADTVDVTLQNTYTVVTVPLDSATAINWKKSTSRLYPGDAVTFITSNATVDTILVSLCYNRATTIGTYKTAPAETKVITAVYDGTMLKVMTSGNWGTSYFTRTGTTLTTAVAGDTVGDKAGNLYLSGTTSINGTLGVSGLLTATLYNFVPAAGVAGDSVAYTLNSTPDITISTGTKLTFIVKKANIGAATLAVDGAAAADLEEYTGGTLNALDANDMIVGQPVEVLWNGSKWILISAH